MFLGADEKLLFLSFAANRLSITNLSSAEISVAYRDPLHAALLNCLSLSLHITFTSVGCECLLVRVTKLSWAVTGDPVSTYERKLSFFASSSTCEAELEAKL